MLDLIQVIVTTLTISTSLTILFWSETIAKPHSIVDRIGKNDKIDFKKELPLLNSTSRFRKNSQEWSSLDDNKVVNSSVLANYFSDEQQYDSDKIKSNLSSYCTDIQNDKSIKYTLLDSLAARKHVNLTISHPLFETHQFLTQGIVYQVKLSAGSTISRQIKIRNFSLASTIDGVAGGQFFSGDATKQLQQQSFVYYDNKCPSVIKLTSFDNDVTLSVNWSSLTPTADRPSYNVTFKLSYHIENSLRYYEIRYNFTVVKNCKVNLHESHANISWRTLPSKYNECQILFPKHSEQYGLVVHLKRLNVPCVNGGYLQFFIKSFNPSTQQVNLTSTSTFLTNSFHQHTSSESQSQSENIINASTYNKNSSLTSYGSLLPSHLLTSTQTDLAQLYPHARIQTPPKLCGKLEELGEGDRSFYFTSTQSPSLFLYKSPLFVIEYKLVDYCYNVTFIAQNASFFVVPKPMLDCTYRINLAYGYRVAIMLKLSPNVEPTASFGSAEDYPEFEQMDNYRSYDGKSNPEDNMCLGLLLQLFDGDRIWTHCALASDPKRAIQFVSRANRIVLKVQVQKDDQHLQDSLVNLKVFYHAVPVENIIQQCSEFGWISDGGQFCLSVMDSTQLSWEQAEKHCVGKGGHLVSIRSSVIQEIVENMLTQSPGYHEKASYWIGATDSAFEGDFRWSDSLPFSFANWFPGWTQYGHYNKQPNDDGFSNQDCVELRRLYHLPSFATKMASSFYWNDRDCGTANFFICERLLTDEPIEENLHMECNRTIGISRQHPRTVVSSPAFPRYYPDNANCIVDITSPPGYRIILDFDEFILEDEPQCGYDYLEIIESNSTSSTSQTLTSVGDNWVNSSEGVNKFRDSWERKKPEKQETPATIRKHYTQLLQQQQQKKLCGDWSERLKLLRYVSRGSSLHLHFVSDYSHHFSGYKVRVSIENVMECADDRLLLFNNSCYLFISYPEVTWFTAQQICKGMKSHLASVESAEEERFVTTNIRKSLEYNANVIYWLGAKLTANGQHEWLDDSSNTYSGWMLGESPNERGIVIEEDALNPMCLGVQWSASSIKAIPSGLYWNYQKCTSTGGYVCKRRNHVASRHGLNRTVTGTEGRITSPNYPGNYPNNLDYWIKIVGPDRSRLVIQFSRIDIEAQVECLYDFVELKNDLTDNSMRNFRLCGSHDTNMDRFNYVSRKNVAYLVFHSDFTVSDSGFSITWQSVDVSSCPVRTTTAQEGIITSPNYPNFLLPELDCTYTVSAPKGKRIWLEMKDYSFSFADNGNEVFEKTSTDLLINLSNDDGFFRPFQLRNHLNDGAFVSYEERIQIRLQTKSNPIGRGFKAIYKILNDVVIEETRTVDLSNVTHGTMLHLNYPIKPSPNVDFIQHLVAPLGHVIVLDLYHVRFVESFICEGGKGVIEVIDNYAHRNGTKWHLCENIVNDDDLSPTLSPPLTITSFLNTLYVRQIGHSYGVVLNGSIRVVPDTSFKIKLLKFQDNENVESCLPNPCQNFGKCVVTGNKKFCKCDGHFTGIFCALTFCELEPCVFGQCELTTVSFKCLCRNGYTGETCEQRQRPCEVNPCNNRGRCIEVGDSFKCQCHAWWEGPRCERKMRNIPYKPLSERMFHEPFWLGLITVFVVMGIIGLVWCAKRHFPEKLEKLLAEEAERNRNRSSARGSSLRDQYNLSSGSNTPGAVVVTPSQQANACQRSLFGRLGIRKPSLLSLTSPSSVGASAAATSRTFSLDDLLKPPPRRSPSPRKKRTNSTPTKRSNAVEKSQILQQLVSPASRQRSLKVNLGELIQLSDKAAVTSNDSHNDKDHEHETSFINVNLNSREQSIIQTALDDAKLEKKVTFARLLNKISNDMSSGSDVEFTTLKPFDGLHLPIRSASTPPSPAAEIRSHNSSDRGSDFSLDLSNGGSATDLSHHKKSGRRVKPASADSILAMFRNFSSTNLQMSKRPSPSSTPTPSQSSPQEDTNYDDDSSTSSAHTVNSFSTSMSDSLMSQKVEVTVHDSRGKTSPNNLQTNNIYLEVPGTVNKCLSPIRELPTPLPTPMVSPAPTPMRQRSPTKEYKMSFSDDRISIEIRNDDTSEDEDAIPHDASFDVQAEDGLIPEEAALMQRWTHRNNKCPSITIGSVTSDDTDSTSNENQRFHNYPHLPLIIPTLMVQQPSPTRRTPPEILIGSPPPHRGVSALLSSFNNELFESPGPSTSNCQHRQKRLQSLEKPVSLDLSMGTPMITITCSLSDAESSDLDNISPANKSTLHPGSNNMCYLSPFSMRTEHTSESNLSSSGYSSMASPGPSRCNSNNPLYSEMEDQGPSGSKGCKRRPSPLLGNCGSSSSVNQNDSSKNVRGRSDSETLSDDPLVESNDEGISTDHLEEKPDSDCTNDTNIESVFSSSPVINHASVAVNKLSITLPSIVIDEELNDDFGDDNVFSPCLSRSESPLSDSKIMYINSGLLSHKTPKETKDLVPFTDSDGLSCGDLNHSDRSSKSLTTTHHRKTGRRRVKSKDGNLGTTPSPNKRNVSSSLSQLLDIPGCSRERAKLPTPRKLSPKQRLRAQRRVSSSSSSDSLNSNHETSSMSTPSMETVRWPSLGEWLNAKKGESLVDGDDPENLSEQMLPKSSSEVKFQKKISRLRTISHQIRFLRRLEQSLKRHGKQFTFLDSDENEYTNRSSGDINMSSPLLGIDAPEIRKTASFSKLNSSAGKCEYQKLSTSQQSIEKDGRPRRNYRDYKWSKVPNDTNSGFSD